MRRILEIKQGIKPLLACHGAFENRTPFLIVKEAINEYLADVFEKTLPNCVIITGEEILTMGKLV